MKKTCPLCINNAGIFIAKALAKLGLAEWNRRLAVNLTGCFLVDGGMTRKMIDV